MSKSQKTKQFKFFGSLTLVLLRGVATTPNSFRPGAQNCTFKVGRSGGWWFLNWIILKIFEAICTPNFVCKLEWPFSNIFCKKSHENRMFLRFFTNFCLYFTHKMAISQFSWAHSHYDVIVTSYIKGTSHDFIFQVSLFSTLADIFAV